MRFEKRDLRSKSEILHDERLKKSRARGDGVEEKSKWGILTPTSYSSPVFPHSLLLSKPSHNEARCKRHVDSAKHRAPRRGRGE